MSTPPTRTLSTEQAAVLLARADDAAGVRLRRAVDASLARHGVHGADRDDARAEVALALLTAPPRPRLELDAACALAARIARNKAVDQHRRRRHETSDEHVLEQIAVPVEGRLAHDLDAVSGEAHRRGVSAALESLITALPAAEQLALRAAAADTGAGGSGLGRSSHYRALERARTRLAEHVRARIAGGLALPLALLRTLGPGPDGASLRAVAGPAVALLTAAVASVALVLPTTGTPHPPAPHAPTPVRHAAAPAIPVVRPIVTTPRKTATPAPVVRVSARHGSTAIVGRPKPTPTRVAPARTARRPAAPVRHTVTPTTTPISSSPDAGLGPCRAAHLCS